MDIITPDPNLFTIYSKSGCLNCNKVKKILKEKLFDFVVVDCDEYLLENKEAFLKHIELLVGTGTEIRTFPIVFHNGKFIGGYLETNQYLKEYKLDFEINSDF